VVSQLKSFNGVIVGSFSSVSFVGAFDLMLDLLLVRLRCRLHRQAQRHDPINNAPKTDWSESVPSRNGIVAAPRNVRGNLQDRGISSIRYDQISD
jgi:hypothetical protein